MLRTIAYLLIAAFVGWALAAPSHFGAISSAALAFSTQNFSWFYLWAVFAMVVASLVLAFGRYGSIRLGDDDEEPAFSRMSWFSMLFAAGMGIGLVFWGVAEPLSHYVTPPPGIAPKTPEAANAAMRYAFFHWGIHPWAVYSVVALAIAFFQFRRKLPITIGATMSGLPARMQGRWVHAVDLLAVLATAFGVATSPGLGALQINSGLARVFGLPVGVASQVGIIVVTTAIFLASSASGLDRGIKWLSNTNLVLAGMLALFVLSHIPNRIFMGYTVGEMLIDIPILLGYGLLFTIIYLVTENLFVAVGVHALVNEPTLVTALPFPAQLILLVMVVVMLVVWRRFNNEAVSSHS